MKEIVLENANNELSFTCVQLVSNLSLPFSFSVVLLPLVLLEKQLNSFYFLLLSKDYKVSKTFAFHHCVLHFEAFRWVCTRQDKGHWGKILSSIHRIVYKGVKLSFFFYKVLSSWNFCDSKVIHVGVVT